jgi:site-specific DNA-cytosine methylase
VQKPASTVTGSGAGYLIESDLAKPEACIIRFKGTGTAEAVDAPLTTVESGGLKHGLAESSLTKGDFLVRQQGKSDAEPIEAPVSTILAGPPKHYLAQAMLLGQQGGAEARPDSEPCPTVASKGAVRKIDSSLEQPQFILELAYGEKGDQSHRSKDIKKPLGAITGSNNWAVADAELQKTEGFLVQSSHGNGKAEKNADNRRVKSTQKPLGTVTGSHDWSIAQTQLHPKDASFIAKVNHAEGKNGDDNRVKSIDRPVSTICGNRGEMALVNAELEPFSIAIDHKGGKGKDPTGQIRSLQKPVSTVTSKARHCVVEPSLKMATNPTGHLPDYISFYRTISQREEKGAHVLTITQFDPETEGLPSHGYVFVNICGDIYQLEVKLRMLEPHELALAQGFKKSHKFTGTKTEVVKQIGNAVPRRLARAIVAAALCQNADAPELLCKWEEAEEARQTQQIAA